ncbi:hypothetical protein [Methyloversatilis sp.]|uniref:hypothetical protein n=1 Tax=Methyloversatilis sp. TaxID=2569862 RepID=UPI0035B4E3CD
MDFEKINVSNMRKYSEAAVFSKIALAMLKQGKRAVRRTQGVTLKVYRDKNGCRCAAGFMLTERHLREIDRKDICNDVWGSVVKKLRISEHHFDLIEDMQNLHDDVKPSRWRAKLADYAIDKGYKLYPEVHEAIGTTWE